MAQLVTMTSGILILDTTDKGRLARPRIALGLETRLGGLTWVGSPGRLLFELGLQSLILVAGGFLLVLVSLPPSRGKFCSVFAAVGKYFCCFCLLVVFIFCNQGL